MILERYLVVSANGDMRLITRFPRLCLNEVAFRLTVEVPAGWGKRVGDIHLTIPDGLVQIETSEPIASEPEDEAALIEE